MSDQLFNFDELVREHQAGLRAFIRALGADEAWVDDIAQESFIVAYKKRAEFDATADFGKWLRGIARRQVMAERTKTARRSRILHEGVCDVLAGLGNDEKDEEPDLKAMVIAMKDCVAALPADQAEILRMRYQDGRQAKDLATSLERTADAIRKQLQRIREGVRRCVEGKMKEVAS